MANGLHTGRAVHGGGRFGPRRDGARPPNPNGGSSSSSRWPRQRGASPIPDGRAGIQRDKKAAALPMASMIAANCDAPAIIAAAAASTSAPPILMTSGDLANHDHPERPGFATLVRATACCRRTVAWRFSTGDCAESARSRISSISRSTRVERSPGSLAFIVPSPVASNCPVSMESVTVWQNRPGTCGPCGRRRSRAGARRLLPGATRRPA